jgi:hypothetical protein
MEPTALPHKDGPNVGTLAVMATGGVLVAGGFASGGLVEDTPALLFLAPLVGGATTYVLGEVMGHRGDPLRSLGWTALGAVPGAAVMGLSIAVGGDRPLSDLGAETLVPFIAGYLLYVGLPPVATAAGHYVAPTVQATPEGAAPGISLRLGL